MKTILKPRCTGKTTEAIKLAAETGSYIVCSTRQDAAHIVAMAKEMGLDIPWPLSADEFISGQFCGRNIKGFVIDNTDYILQALARGVPIRAVYMTEEGLSPIGINPDSGLDEQEQACMDALVEAWNFYRSLPVQHPDESRVFRDAIHAAQDQLICRVVRRCFPKGYTSMKKPDPTPTPNDGVPRGSFA